MSVLDLESSAGRVRWAWIVAGVIVFLAAALPVASMGSLRKQLVLRGEVHRVVDEISVALASEEVHESKACLLRLRLLLDRLSLDAERASLLRTVGVAVAAYVSAPSLDGLRQSQKALARFKMQLVTESRALESELIRRAIGVGLVGLCASLLLVLVGLRGEVAAPMEHTSIRESKPVVQRLARLVEISGRRERRTDRFLASMEATLVDIDRHGHVEYISPGGSHLFQMPIGTLLNQSAKEVIILTSDDGSVVHSFRHASASRKAYWLHARDGSRQLVNVDFFEDALQGASVLLRLAKSREVRRRTVRELQAVCEVAFSDDRLIMMLIDGEGRISRSSPAAERWLQFSGPGATVFEPWAEKISLGELYKEPASVDTREFRFECVLHDATGHQAKTEFRLAYVDDVGWSIRGWVDCSSAQKSGSTSLESRVYERVTAENSSSSLPDATAPSTTVVANGIDIPPSVQDGASCRPQVLVIDDEPAIGRAIVRALNEMDVMVAEGGSEGLQVALAYPDRWDLILCDLGMPGLDGIGVYEAFLSEKPSLLDRTIFMTGALHTERARGFVRKVNPPLLTKPFDVAQVRNVLKHWSISSRPLD
ncbi:MAG: response regulator [Myxococcales bacterium]|nr:response regulator [Myxococcales bacterium]